MRADFYLFISIYLYLSTYLPNYISCSIIQLFMYMGCCSGHVCVCVSVSGVLFSVGVFVCV